MAAKTIATAEIKAVTMATIYAVFFGEAPPSAKLTMDDRTAR
jgi:hypothetical protein